MLREIFALTTGCRDGFQLFPTAQVITSRQRLPVIHHYNTNVRRANKSFPILRIEKYFYARVYARRVITAAQISFQNSLSPPLVFSFGAPADAMIAHCGREDTQANRLSRDVILSRRYTCHLIPACVRLRRSSSFYVKEAPWEGRKFRSVGSIKKQGTNYSIDISEMSPLFPPPQRISPTLDIKCDPLPPPSPSSISNRIGQVRGQALSVNQGKWFVKEQARHVKSGMQTHNATRVFLRLRLRRYGVFVCVYVYGCFKL